MGAVVEPGWDGMAARALAGVVPGDHLSCTFGSDQEQRQLVGRAARDAFERGERLRYGADRSDAETLCDWLEDAGLDVRSALAGGQLEIASCHELYLAGSGFDGERKLAGLAAEVERARRHGFSGLTVMGEMSWLRDRPEDAARVVAYEERIDHALEGSGLVTICQYDRRLFPEDVRASLEGAHHFRVATGPEGSVVTHGALTVRESEDGLALAGDLDLRDADYVGARLVAHRPPESEIVLDAADLSFINLRALMQAAERLPADRRVLIVDLPPGAVLRDSPAAALAALEAAPSWDEQIRALGRLASLAEQLTPDDRRRMATALARVLGASHTGENGWPSLPSPPD